MGLLSVPSRGRDGRLVIRTDHPELPEAERVRRIFDALPEHPLASGLLFVDPLEVAPSLVA